MHSDLLSKSGKFPIDRDVNGSFVGCLITREADRLWRVYWNVEASVSSIALKEEKSFHSISQAIDYFIAREYEHGIDGIPIEPNR